MKKKLTIILAAIAMAVATLAVPASASDSHTSGPTDCPEPTAQNNYNPQCGSSLSVSSPHACSDVNDVWRARIRTRVISGDNGDSALLDDRYVQVYYGPGSTDYTDNYDNSDIVFMSNTGWHTSKGRKLDHGQKLYNALGNFDYIVASGSILVQIKTVAVCIAQPQ